MKVLILGASGILGQTMRLYVPDHVQAVYHRRTADALHIGCDLTNAGATRELIESVDPQCIINLAGESRPDVVEKDRKQYEQINEVVPCLVAQVCAEKNIRLVHVSTQAVFSGSHDSYEPQSLRVPMNAYGEQKAIAEDRVLDNCPNSIIARPTFVLGIRPLPHVGRTNPVEQMLSGQNRQVYDRFFSPLFARDAARSLWGIAIFGSPDRIVHLGLPKRVTRFDIAAALGVDAQPVRNDDFPGIAPRPMDTTYAQGSTYWFSNWRDGIEQLRRDWRSRETMDVADRAKEIAIFLGISEVAALERLSLGFGHQHAAVTEDFRSANPQTDEALLEWYRNTEAYIYELSVYHCDPGFNYSGMCEGIAERLKAAGARRVLCLGDGIGDLTLALHRAGFEAVYHDLLGSRTAEFARFRFARHTGAEMAMELTAGWEPMFMGKYDAIVSLDFLEHVPNVLGWAAAIKDALVPGGLFVAQNAFAMGSGPSGSMPMHLERNDRYEREWDPLLAGLGFRQDGSNWYVRAA